MTPHKQFKVFGDPIEVLVSSASTGNHACAITELCEPGGGPPPHHHLHEDELFMPLEGEFDLFDGTTWQRIPAGAMVFGQRGKTHAFRNCGTTPAKMLIVATPGGLDEYLEKISPLSIPADLERLTEISNSYGITFVTPAPKEAPAPAAN